MKLIDVSVHNGKIDWEAVKGKIDGAIIRCGYGSDIDSQDDKMFKRNADECTRLGIPFGVYLYSYAKTLDMALSEAAHTLRLIKPYKLSFPVYLDLEESGTEKGAVDRAIAFGNEIEAAGYWCGIYANENWWDNYLGSSLDRFTKWVAKYSANKPHVKDYDIWQYSSSGTTEGIEGSVDVSECYRDFPKEICGKSAAQPKQPEVDYANYQDKSMQNGREFKTIDALNLRTGASTSKDIILTIPAGATVKTYGYYSVFNKKRWYYVVYNGYRGFVCSAYLK